MARISLMRIWIGLKVALLALVLLYTLLFIFKNNQAVGVWLFFDTVPQMSLLVALLGAFVLGSLLTLLLRTILTTARQIRAARARERSHRLEREIDDMRTKASALKPRDAAKNPGLGVGKKAGDVMPDGIEKKVQAMTMNGGTST